jgi:predicted NAD/FAD-dependent oxidoreductase
MKTRLVSLLVVLVALFAFALPVFAASGDAKVTIADATTQVVLCVATLTTPCNVQFVSGHYYSFTVQEASNQDAAELHVLVAPNNTYFTNRTWAYVYSTPPNTNPCTVTDATGLVWKIDCVATSNRVSSATLQGRASATTDNRGKGTVKLLPSAASSATFSYFTP